MLRPIIIAVVAGWLAGRLTRGHGFGGPMNFLLGLVGAILAAFVLNRVGIERLNLPLAIAASTVGALVIIWLGRQVSTMTAKSPPASS